MNNLGKLVLYCVFGSASIVSGMPIFILNDVKGKCDHLFEDTDGLEAYFYEMYPCLFMEVFNIMREYYQIY